MIQNLREPTEDQFVPGAVADDLPAGGPIEPFRPGAGVGREHGGAMSGAAKRVAGGPKQSTADAAAFTARIDKERPDRAVARVAGGETLDLPVFFPDPDARMLREPRIIPGCHQGWIPQPVFLHRKADLGDAIALIVARAANMPGHCGSLSLEHAGK